MIYLDNAATTLKKPPGVARAIRDCLNNAGSAGRGGHSASMYSADVLYDCREEAASLFNISEPERVVFTYNATHALNLAINSLAEPGGHVLISGYEHNAVVRPLHKLSKSGLDVTTITASPFNAEEIANRFEDALLNNYVSFVVCVHVSNVFGYILPIERIAAICKKRGVPLIVDASQSAGCIGIDADSCPGTYWCMPGHKALYGPQGTGLLLLPKDNNLLPLLYGGTGSDSINTEMPDYPPDRFEAGTHNTHGVAGLLEGIRYIRKHGVESIRAYEKELIEYAVKKLSPLPRVKLYTASDPGLQSSVLSFNIEGMNSGAAAEKLAGHDIAVRGGLHCAPLAHKTDGTFPDGTVRMSVSAFTTQVEIDKLVYALGRNF